uniref:Uncharacterized protein n=1 Tax=Ananas comosus var. bracteatus TaxID=296719 RepID=A0A6V7PWQ2_ANACO|nr:unnamed protein product [Ananas comosus var. bracteatus]
MGRRSGKKPLFFFSKKSRSTKRMELQPRVSATSPIPNAKALKNYGGAAAEAATAAAAAAATSGGAGGGSKGAKKKSGARLWMRFDRTGHTEIMECDKNAIIKRAAIPTATFGSSAPSSPTPPTSLPGKRLWLSTLNILGL